MALRSGTTVKQPRVGPSILVDARGKPLVSSPKTARRPRRGDLQAKYDAAQTFMGNQKHWSNADSLDPHSANSLTVRQTLRSRSRYEVIENNPYLKGTVISLCNDFTGSGPKLQITDKRLTDERRRLIEKRWNDWGTRTRFRHKLWRMRLSKIVDGESFMMAYSRPIDGQTDPVTLDFFVIEADRISSWEFQEYKNPEYNEVDGIRFDDYENPVYYGLLNQHPGGSVLTRIIADTNGGQWIPSRYMIHWFRQERGWLRGIPELTSSLPLCALLRRYTLAVVRAAEVAANFSAVLETELPPALAAKAWTDGSGNLLDDDPFDTFPLEMGLITALPWHTKLKQLQSEQPTTGYDDFVAALLREIIRPILVPYNRAAGTSEKSNMASSVVDDEFYKSGQQAERRDAEECILNPALSLWWEESTLLDSYLDDPVSDEPSLSRISSDFSVSVPDHVWRWDPIGVEHTDPEKVANSIKVMFDSGFITDRDIQESRFNRSIEDWQEDMEAQLEFRRKLGMLPDVAQKAEDSAKKAELDKQRFDMQKQKSKSAQE